MGAREEVSPGGKWLRPWHFAIMSLPSWSTDKGIIKPRVLTKSHLSRLRRS